MSSSGVYLYFEHISYPVLCFCYLSKECVLICHIWLEYGAPPDMMIIHFHANEALLYI